MFTECFAIENDCVQRYNRNGIKIKLLVLARYLLVLPSLPHPRPSKRTVHLAAKCPPSGHSVISWGLGSGPNIGPIDPDLDTTGVDVVKKPGEKREAKRASKCRGQFPRIPGKGHVPGS